MRHKEELSRLVGDCADAGITVKFVGKNVLHDYAAMNPLAAKEISFPLDDHTILVDKDMTTKRKLNDLKHEIREMKLMLRGMKYWPAHVKTLKEIDDKGGSRA